MIILTSAGVFSWCPELTEEEASLAKQAASLTKADNAKEAAAAAKNAAKDSKAAKRKGAHAAASGKDAAVTDTDLHGKGGAAAATTATAADAGGVPEDDGSDVVKFESKFSLEVGQGELVAVCGKVGSGKSSLVAALLGEMTRVSGTVATDGSIAYVAQTAWIINATLKNNILLGLPYDEERYHAVLDACDLVQDIAILPAGAETEIGEKVRHPPSITFDVP